MIDNKVPLSGRETALLATWERERARRVTLRELRDLLGPSAARETAKGLVRKGLLERVAPGIFLIHPLRSLARRQAISSAVATAAILAEEPYYLGGWWALSLHRLRQQFYSSRLDAYVTRERRSRVLSGARIVFHVLPGAAFTYGVQTVTFEGTAVQVSDPERTVLDALDYPKTFGGVRETLRLVRPSLPRLDRQRLIDYAARGSRTSTCQRLAVLLERLDTPRQDLEPLGRRIGETTTLLSMLPDAPRVGPVHAAWRVVENDPETADSSVDVAAEGSSC